MKNIFSIRTILAVLTITLTFAVAGNGCKTPEEITMKSGAQLWAENCTRCHNAPDPHTYSDDQWDAGTEHMRQKALLTDAEITRIRDFLKAAN